MYGRVVILAFVVFLGTTIDGQVIDDSAPQLLHVVGKPRSTSVEFQVRRLRNSVHEPCAYGHAVQIRFHGEGHLNWMDTRITETATGQFKITGLKSGREYEVRVACKDQGTPSRPGIFSQPKSFETPFVDPIKTNGGVQEQEGQTAEDDKRDDNSSSVATFLTPTVIMLGITTFTTAGFRFN